MTCLCTLEYTAKSEKNCGSEWKQSACAICFGRESQKEPGYGIFHVNYLVKMSFQSVENESTDDSDMDLEDPLAGIRSAARKQTSLSSHTEQRNTDTDMEVPLNTVNQRKSSRNRKKNVRLRSPASASLIPRQKVIACCILYIKPFFL